MDWFEDLLIEVSSEDLLEVLTVWKAAIQLDAMVRSYKLQLYLFVELVEVFQVVLLGCEVFNDIVGGWIAEHPRMPQKVPAIVHQSSLQGLSVDRVSWREHIVAFAHD